MTTILHISTDYPDVIAPGKTQAIARLVTGTAADFDHRVYSLNRVPMLGGGRVAAPGTVSVADDDGQIASWRYAAPGRGLWLETAMRGVARAIVADCRARGVRPVLVHGHKLSMEGLVAADVAAALGIPYVLSLQGNTDQRILSVRRDMRRRFGAVYRGAAGIFPFAPWIERWCTRRLGAPAAVSLLPCVPLRDATLAPRAGPPRIISAFHLAHYRNKNAAGLIAGAARAMASVAGATLEIAGDGPDAATAAIDAMIARSGAGRAVARIGAVAPEGIQQWMNGAAVFVMPSFRESFGMVFVEALLAGCPIIYPENRSVAGYFDGAPFAVAVPPGDPAAIGAATAQMLADQPARKAALAAWQKTPAAHAFTRDAILERYRDGLGAAIGDAVAPLSRAG